MPSQWLARAPAPIRWTATAAPAVIHVVLLALNGMKKPPSYEAMDLPEVKMLHGYGEDPTDSMNNIRTVAAVGILLSFLVQQWILNTLGKQFHFIGVRLFQSHLPEYINLRCCFQPREKAQIVSDGPYGYVRHPLYS